MKIDFFYVAVDDWRVKGHSQQGYKREMWEFFKKNSEDNRMRNRPDNGLIKDMRQ